MGLLIKNMDWYQCVSSIPGDVDKYKSPSLTSNDPTKALNKALEEILRLNFDSKPFPFKGFDIFPLNLNSFIILCSEITSSFLHSLIVTFLTAI